MSYADSDELLQEELRALRQEIQDLRETNRQISNSVDKMASAFNDFGNYIRGWRPWEDVGGQTQMVNVLESILQELRNNR